MKYTVSSCGYRTCKLFIGISTIFLLCLAAVSLAQGDSKYCVLVLHSYNKGLPWTDNISKGIESAFEPLAQEVELKFEYMDSRAVKFDQLFKTKLYELYKHKYNSSKFDIIIASDDNALHFLRQYHRDLFAKTPVVFCGVNNIKAPNIVDRNLFTGILEVTAEKETLDLALKLHSGIKKVVIICGNSPSGNSRWNQVKRIFNDYPQLQFSRIDSSFSMPEIEEKMKKLTDDTIVIYATLYRDKTGHFFSLKEGVKRISSASRRPVYTYHCQVLLNGTIGGKVLGGLQHGLLAAKMSQRILRGERPADISIINKSLAEYKFDYNELKRFGIAISDLPKDSVVVRRPFSFYEEYKDLVWIIACSITLLVIIIITLLFNITRRKNAEDEQLKLAAKLQQARKMEAIGTLAGGIAHDFNNILTAILGHAELAKMKLYGQKDILSNVNEVINAGFRAKDLVSQILTSSRLVEQERMPIEIQLIAKEALNLIRASLPATIEINEKINPQCGKILADATQMHQVLMNLCTNAYHAMQNTGGELTVELLPVELKPEDLSLGLSLAPGSYLKLMVTDTGHGMNETTRERIFDPYFSTKAKDEGTGMGLALVHGIVKNHGGQISVHSEPEAGTVFAVYLPVVKETAVVVSNQTKQQLEETIPGGNENILLVDDEQSIVKFFKALLENLGYQVSAMTDSRQALEVFEAHPENFDLIITDMTMPHLTGVSLAEKALNVKPDIPVIICSGFNDQIEEVKAKNLGIRVYLTKPVSSEKIARVVRRELDSK